MSEQEFTPVYLITGFLESGKTQLINSMLTDDNFSRGQKTLVICCEEGVEEYETAKNTTVVVLDEADEMNTKKMEALDKEYQPERVIIEYNSMITKNSRSQKTYPRQVEKYCTIARLLGVQNFNTVTTIRALVAWVQFMLREMDIPLSISQTGKCTRAEYFKAIPDMAEAALQDACTPTNPRQPSKDDIMEIYERLW